MKNALFPIALLLILAACGPAAIPPTLSASQLPTTTETLAPSSTNTPKPTDTLQPTASPSPDVPHPTTNSNLSPQNNASMVLENGTWVVKNAAGKTAAMWDSTKNEWTYNFENIQMQVGIVEPRYVVGFPDTIREGITVNVPSEMLRPLSPAQQDQNPLVPSGYYGDFNQTSQKGNTTKAEIGVDYRGIILIDKNNSVIDNLTNKWINTEQYVIIFTVQYKDHPDVLNVLLVAMNNTHNDTLYLDLFPKGSADVTRPNDLYSNDDFIAMLKAKNPIGRRMAIYVSTSTIAGTTDLGYNPDNKTMVYAIAAGKPIAAGLDVRFMSHYISTPHGLR